MYPIRCQGVGARNRRHGLHRHEAVAATENLRERLNLWPAWRDQACLPKKKVPRVKIEEQQ
jgi:hypothetical protein